MIFVTVGTTHFPFDRLMIGVAALRVDDEIVVQRGASTVPLPNARVVDYLSFDEVVDHVRAARLVISHAGVGSIMVALANDRRPILVPRLARFGEAVDDHQVEVARALEERGRAVVVDDPLELRDITSASGAAVGEAGLPPGPLVAIVADEVRAAFARRR